MRVKAIIWPCLTDYLICAMFILQLLVESHVLFVGIRQGCASPNVAGASPAPECLVVFQTARKRRSEDSSPDTKKRRPNASSCADIRKRRSNDSSPDVQNWKGCAGKQGRLYDG